MNILPQKVDNKLELRSLSEIQQRIYLIKSKIFYVQCNLNQCFIDFSQIIYNPQSKSFQVITLMHNTRQKLFSDNRIGLFTHQNTSNHHNSNFYMQNNQKYSEVQSPSEKNQPRQVLLLIIEKKDSQIRSLRRKLKIFQTDLLQTKQKLDSTNYELKYFKRKICEEFEKSKDLQTQIEITNGKIIEMIKQLSCVKKLKNPIQIKNNHQDWSRINQEIQRTIQNEKPSNQIDKFCIDFLQKQIIKVSTIIESALSIKKLKIEQSLTGQVLINNDIFTL